MPCLSISGWQFADAWLVFWIIFQKKEPQGSGAVAWSGGEHSQPHRRHNRPHCRAGMRCLDAMQQLMCFVPTPISLPHPSVDYLPHEELVNIPYLEQSRYSLFMRHFTLLNPTKASPLSHPFAVFFRVFRGSWNFRIKTWHSNSCPRGPLRPRSLPVWGEVLRFKL